MKKLLIFIILAFVLALPVAADVSYNDTYETVGADSLSQALDDTVQDFFSSSGIDPSDYNWVNKLTDKNVLLHIFEFITSGIKKPIRTGVAVIGVILITAALISFGGDTRTPAAIYASALAVTAIIAGDIWQSVSAAVNATKGCGSFMLSFVPIFASVVALSGKTVTAASMSSLLLFASEAVSFVSSFVILPLMGGYLALSISTGVSPLLNNSGIVESVKKISMWALSLLGTLFVGILSIQTAVNSASDSVALRTAKFILGTSVPVAGSALSEAVATVSASMGLLRSSIGIYGVVALAALLLPVLIELVMWRCVLFFISALSELFSLSKITSILKAVDSMLSVLLGVILLIGAMFIISLTIVVTAGKT